MINMNHDARHFVKQRGVTTLTTTLVLTLVLAILTFFTVSVVVHHQRYSSLSFKTQQAFNAAQAGSEYAFTYLDANPSAVTDNLTLSATLEDGSSYNVQYQFQGGDNTKIKISSVGTDAEGTATRTIQQLVQKNILFGPIPSLPLQSREQVALGGSAKIENLENNNTIISGSTVTLTGSAQTILVSGVSSNKHNLGPDITQNDTTLKNMSNSDFEVYTLGRSVQSFKNFADMTYSQSSNYNYNSELSGKTGSTIWITQSGGEAILNSDITIGSSENPVNIIVDGQLNIGGGVVIYGNVVVSQKIVLAGHSVINGLVFASQEADIGSSGGPTINGGLLVGDAISMSGSTSLKYNSSILTSTSQSSTSYGKITGSWNDLNPGG